MSLKEGWLNRQYSKVSADVERWPSWMKREAGLDHPNEPTRYETKDAQPDVKTERPTDS